MGITGAKAIALVDCDAFYASCEQLLNPSLKGKPVVVMSNNNGCVVARSKEAKALGVKMGMPVFQAKKAYPDVCYLPGRLEIYGEISNRVMSVLAEFTPEMEIYSIDEAFLDLTGLRRIYRKPYTEIAMDIKNTVAKKVGIPVSVGVSLSKVLAKLATERAKKSEGYYTIGFRQITEELKSTKVMEIWGIGSNTAALLNKFGVYSAYDLTLQSDKWITKLLGKKGLELRYELSGESVYPVNTRISKPESIQKTSSFASFTSNEAYIRNSLKYHAHRACKKLRKIQLKTALVSVMLRTKDFKILYGSKALVYPTNWEFEIFSSIDNLFSQIFIPDLTYRSSGVILGKFSEINNEQLSLFESSQKRSQNDSLSQTLDHIEQKHGKNILLPGIFNLNPLDTPHDTPSDAPAIIF